MSRNKTVFETIYPYDPSSHPLHRTEEQRLDYELANLHKNEAMYKRLEEARRLVQEMKDKETDSSAASKND